MPIKSRSSKNFKTGGYAVFSDREPRRNEDEMYREAKLPILKHRRILHLLNLMYNRSKRNDLLDKRDLPTRQFDKIKFKVITPAVKVAFKCTNYLGAQLWDKLPFETQCSPSFHEFKRRAKNHISEGLFNTPLGDLHDGHLGFLSSGASWEIES